MRAMPDVVIIGGGPAGLYAGARLAAAGVRTTVVEEHPAVGEPVHCTGVLAAEAFDEFNLSRQSVLNELSTARFWSPAGHQLSYSGAKVEAVVIDRRVFDQELYSRALQAGVCVERDARASAIQVDASGVTVKLAGREIRARVAILACGANYSLHRQVGLGMPRMFLHTAQIELPARRLGDVELHFGREVAPKGFGWVVPVVRRQQLRVRVGVMCENDAPRYFERLAARIADRWQIETADIQRPRQKILAAGAITSHVRKLACSRSEMPQAW